MPYWNSESTTKNAYWESLSTIHSFTLFISFLELFVKVGLAGLVFLGYKANHPDEVPELFKFDYSNVEQPGLASKKFYKIYNIFNFFVFNLIILIFCF